MWIAKKILARYDFQAKKRESISIDFEAALTVRDPHLYSQWSPRGPRFCPWLGSPEFQKFYEGVENHTIVSPDRCYFLMSLASYASNLPGDFAECGVYKGGTALLLSRVMNSQGKTLHLFDSFKGLPQVGKEEEQWWQPGQFEIESVDSVKQLLQDFSDMIDIRPGWIPETFSGLENCEYAFAHIDVDLYQSTLDCCEYFYPRMVPGGIFLFDEYGCPSALGEKDAVDQFLGDKPESVTALPTGQAMFIKLPGV